MYEPRLYRNNMGSEQVKSFIVSYYETDLWISVRSNDYRKEMEEYTYKKIVELRSILERYTMRDKTFIITLNPYKIKPDAPQIVKIMAEAAEKANVGPMAAVAGAFSQIIGEQIKDKFSIKEIIVENGGDIYVSSENSIIISVYAGNSPFSGKFKIEIPKIHLPIGICTSSGTVGHSLSFGKADAVTVICKNTALADSYATALCNEIHNEEDIENVINKTMGIEEIKGIVIVYKNKIGVGGDIKIVK